MSDTALERSSENERQSGDPWQEAVWLPCELAVDLEVSRFTVRDLLELEEGSIIDTQWEVTRDLPVRVNGQLMAWAEFEVVSTALAVRLTGFV